MPRAIRRAAPQDALGRAPRAPPAAAFGYRSTIPPARDPPRRPAHATARNRMPREIADAAASSSDLMPLRRLKRGCSINSSRIGTAKRRGMATRDCCALKTVSHACMSCARSGAGPACRSLSSRSTALHSKMANRNVGVTGLSAMMRASVLASPNSSISRAYAYGGREKCRRRQGKQMLEQTVLLQQGERPGAETRQEQFQALVEQPRRRHPVEQIRELPDRPLGAGLDREIQLRGEAHRAQHAHRILAVARLRIADQLQAPRAAHRSRRRRNPRWRNLRCCSRDRSRRNRGAKRPPRSCHRCCRAGCVRSYRTRGARNPRQVALSHLELRVLRILALRRRRGTKCRDFDDLAAEMHVSQAKAAADEAAISKQPAHFFRQRVGGDVEILRRDPQEQIAHRTAHQERLVARLLQAVKNLQRVRRNRGSAKSDVRREGWSECGNWVDGTVQKRSSA